MALGKIILAILVVGVSWGVYDLLWGSGLCLKPKYEVPDLGEPYWGPGEAPKKLDTSIRSFTIEFSDAVVADLKNRLDNTRFTPPLEGTANHYGFNSDLLRKVINHWSKNYDWKKRQAYLNKFPHFLTNIQGLDIHYLHVKPKKTAKKTLPLMLLHGWPGSIREFYEIIDMLIEEKDGVAFEVIVPSLPGYGWSSGASKPGLAPPQIGVIMNGLMRRLGFEKYYVQGGDWGSQVVTHMAVLFPKRVLGVHINMCLASFLRTNLALAIVSPAPGLFMNERTVRANYPMKDRFMNTMLETGYMHIQSTKPDSLGVGMDNSPAALAAWVLEKFSTGTNRTFRSLPDAGLETHYSLDELLDNLMIYWVGPSSMTTAARIYAEHWAAPNRNLAMDTYAVTVPTWCAKFPGEIAYLPDWILKYRYVNLVGSSEMDEGGHFAAMQVPRLLEKNIRVAIGYFEKSA